MKILLDTNAYSALAKGHEVVCDLVRRSESVYFSMVVVGELLAGFRNGSRYDENRRLTIPFRGFHQLSHGCGPSTLD